MIAKPLWENLDTVTENWSPNDCVPGRIWSWLPPMWNSHLFSGRGWHLYTQGQVPLSWKIILALHKKNLHKGSWSTLGMTFLVAPGRVFLLQPQQPPVASHRDMLVIKFVIASHHHYEPYHSHHPTDAERRHDDIPWLILQLLIQTTTKHLR